MIFKGWVSYHDFSWSYPLLGEEEKKRKESTRDFVGNLSLSEPSGTLEEFMRHET